MLLPINPIFLVSTCNSTHIVAIFYIKTRHKSIAESMDLLKLERLFTQQTQSRYVPTLYSKDINGGTTTSTDQINFLGLHKCNMVWDMIVKLTT